MTKKKQVDWNNVVFLPVVGKSYKAHGRAYLGKRVMVLGASHYCEHYEDEKGCGKACAHYGKYHLKLVGGERLYFGDCCERFTEIVYARYRSRLKVPKVTGKKNPNAWTGTFSRFYNSFFKDGNPSDKVRNRLLDHLVCTEYVQGAEARKSNENNGKLMKAQRNFDELVKTVKQFKPDVIIAWGPRAWEGLCQGIQNDANSNVVDEKHVSLAGCCVTVIRTQHPSSWGKNGFDREEFQRRLQLAGIKLCSVKGNAD